jgi:hypothetical protein
MRGCISSVNGADTSVRVSRGTLRELERLRVTLQARTVDETIRRLIRERRSLALARISGIGKGVVTRFTEGDRLESLD